ncbi:hypothetical protein TNCV_4756131 [Trichonephila clavipes]|nr:hypothetical protein TNCV_4756131 [Trichonephila clavipes]
MNLSQNVNFDVRCTISQKLLFTGRRLKFKGGSSCQELSRNSGQLSKSNSPPTRTFRERRSTCVNLCKRLTGDDNEKRRHRTL